ncbi:hypothetical protein EDM68_01365 [Candidatus Uhrbacteria bacterium]|nr:MAG: hypothetical protein EDM68_01365 [Candidatus Uhrbacteria bacterium]
MLDGHRSQTAYRASEAEIEAWMRSPCDSMRNRKRSSSPMLIDAPRPRPFMGVDWKVRVGKANRRR